VAPPSHRRKMADAPKSHRQLAVLQAGALDTTQRYDYGWSLPRDEVRIAGWKQKSERKMDIPGLLPEKVAAQRWRGS
jgi:hypothetical protein